MKRTTFYVLIAIALIYKSQPLMATEIAAMDKAISYLETEVPVVMGLDTYFSAQVLGRQLSGTKQEKYQLKILNNELIIIEKSSIKSAKTMEETGEVSTSQAKVTGVIKLMHLDPKITLIYKTNPTEGNDVMKAMYPPHIKVKIRAKRKNRWNIYRDDILQITSILSQPGMRFPAPDYEAESYLLLTTDEEAAENIANALSYLILLSERGETK